MELYCSRSVRRFSNSINLIFQTYSKDFEATVMAQYCLFREWLGSFSSRLEGEPMS